VAFKRHNDRINGPTSRTITKFEGMSYARGRSDENDSYAYVCDFDFRDDVAELRNGKRKNSLIGYPSSVSGLINIRLSNVGLVGQITNGVLTVYKVSDIIDTQVRRYYTVDEVNAKFTVDELNSKTVNDLIAGNR